MHDSYFKWFLLTPKEYIGIRGVKILKRYFKHFKEHGLDSQLYMKMQDLLKYYSMVRVSRMLLLEIAQKSFLIETKFQITENETRYIQRQVNRMTRLKPIPIGK